MVPRGDLFNRSNKDITEVIPYNGVRNTVKAGGISQQGISPVMVVVIVKLGKGGHLIMENYIELTDINRQLDKNVWMSYSGGGNFISNPILSRTITTLVIDKTFNSFLFLCG